MSAAGDWYSQQIFIPTLIFEAGESVSLYSFRIINGWQTSIILPGLLQLHLHHLTMKPYIFRILFIHQKTTDENMPSLHFLFLELFRSFYSFIFSFLITWWLTGSTANVKGSATACREPAAGKHSGTFRAIKSCFVPPFVGSYGR